MKVLSSTKAHINQIEISTKGTELWTLGQLELSPTLKESLKFLTWKFNNKSKIADEFSRFSEVVNKLDGTGYKIHWHSFTFEYNMMKKLWELIQLNPGIAEIAFGNTEQQFYKPNVIIKNSQVKLYCKSSASMFSEYTVYASKIIINYQRTEHEWSHLLSSNANELEITNFNWITFYKPKIIYGPSSCNIGEDLKLGM